MRAKIKVIIDVGMIILVLLQMAYHLIGDSSAVLFSMLELMVSGVILSRKVFAFLPISGGVVFVCSLHVISEF